MMRVGLLELRLELPGVRSLKEKRGVIRPLLERIRRQHQAAVAEVDHQDVWRSAVLGVALVGNDPGQLQSRLQKILDMVDAADVVMADYRMDIIA